MAFRRKYTKRVYKGSRILKKRNIFKNTSSKSQAKQIYKLNKKVNYIQKTTAPEIQKFQANVFNVPLMAGIDDAITNKNGVLPIFKDLLLNNTNPNFITIKGEMLRSRYMYLYGLFQATSINDLTADYLAGLAHSDPVYRSIYVPWTAYLRIIVCRLKKSTQLIPTKITQAPDQNYNDNGVNYDVKPIIGPLIENVSSQLSIIKDKVIKIDNTKPQKMYKIKLNPKQLGYIYRKAPEGSVSGTAGQNEIIVYYQYVCPKLLQYVNTGLTLDKKMSPLCHFTMNINYGYIDQN